MFSHPIEISRMWHRVLHEHIFLCKLNGNELLHILKEFLVPFFTWGSETIRGCGNIISWSRFLLIPSSTKKLLIRKCCIQVFHNHFRLQIGLAFRKPKSKLPSLQCISNYYRESNLRKGRMEVKICIFFESIENP